MISCCTLLIIGFQSCEDGCQIVRMSLIATPRGSCCTSRCALAFSAETYFTLFRTMLHVERSFEFQLGTVLLLAPDFTPFPEFCCKSTPKFSELQSLARLQSCGILISNQPAEGEYRLLVAFKSYIRAACGKCTQYGADIIFRGMCCSCQECEGKITA